METASVRRLLDDTFRDVALVLGGIFAVHEVRDEAVWQVMKHLDIAHETALGKIEGSDPSVKSAQPKQSYETHPAVEALLLKLKRRSSHVEDGR